MRQILLILPFLLILLFPSSLSAQVVINEFLPNAEPEWVEFYNTGRNIEDLSLYFFDDDNDFNSDEGSSTKIQLSGLLSPSQHCYKDLSTYLNNDKDTPTLFKNDGGIADTYSYATTTHNKSYSRVPDGGDWQFDQEPTKSSISCSSLAPAPTPTPTKTPTNTPTPTQTPTPTSKPTPTPTKKITPTPTEKVTKSGENLVLGGKDEILGSPTPSEENEKEESQNGTGKPILAGLFIIGGIGFIALAAGPFLKDYIKRYNNPTDETKIGNSA